MRDRNLLSQLSLAVEIKLSKYLSATCFLVVVIILPEQNFDPINWPKLLALSIGSFACLFLTISDLKMKSINFQVSLLVLLGLVSCVSFLINGPSSATFWGTQGRATGLLTYLSLIVLAIVASNITTKSALNRIIRWFLFSGLFTVSYMAVQFLDLDPVDWSRKELNATLGNINFTSALLGMVLPASLIYVMSLDVTTFKKFVIFILTYPVTTFLIFKTGSVQGIIGCLLAVLLIVNSTLMRRVNRPKLFLVSSIFFIVTMFVGIFLTSKPKFLGGILFQETVGYRLDYWSAAIEMLKENFIFGLGFDQYGLFYRAFRREEAALGSSLLRFSDSAHSIFLDFVVSSGFIAGLIFSAVLLLVTKNSLLILFGSSSELMKIVAIGWIAYLPQLMIGINQVGVGVWAWLFMGILLGKSSGVSPKYLPPQKSDTDAARKAKDGKTSVLSKDGLDRKSKIEADLPVSKLMMSLVGALLGLTVALPPLFTDAQFNDAYKSGNLPEMERIIASRPSNSFHAEKTLELALTSNNSELILRITRSVVERYPRSVYGWQVLYDLRATPELEREKAGSRLKQLDPYSAEFNKIK